MSAVLLGSCADLGKGHSGTQLPPCPAVPGTGGLHVDYRLGAGDSLACQNSTIDSEEFVVGPDAFASLGGPGMASGVVNAVDAVLGEFNAVVTPMTLASDTWLVLAPGFVIQDGHSVIIMVAGYNSQTENGLAFSQTTSITDPNNNTVNVTCDIVFYEDRAAGGVSTEFTTSTPGPSEWSFQTVLNHEIGHCVGFDHPNNTVSLFSSVMNLSTVAPGNAQTVLSVDDKQAYQYLYP